MYERTVFQLVLGLLCLCTNVAGTNANSTLQLDPPRIVARYRSRISVNCSTNAKYMMMDWEVPQGDSKETGPKTFTWTVESLTEWGMTPFCYITLEDSLQVKAPLSVTIYKIPDSVSISTGGHTGPMVENRQYKLQCDIQKVAPVEFLTVKWYKGETLVNETTFNDTTKSPVNLLPTLQISPNRTDQGAQYRCEAELDLGPEGPQPPPTMMSDPFSITVHYGPEISCLSQITVKQGEEFNPNCTAEGYPTPEMIWFREGEKVDFPRKMDRADAGQYVLNATGNSIANHTLEIKVLYAPVAVRELDNTTVAHGHNVELNCSFIANPRPQYRWTTTARESNLRYRDKNESSLLSIDYATGSNTGTYTCIASNSLGEVSRSVRVDVGATTDTASLSPVNHTGPMVEGRQYELCCNISYVAPVYKITVNWYKGGSLVTSEADTYSINEKKTPDSLLTRLTVSHNRSENGTQYTCEAVLQPIAAESSNVKITSDPHTVIVHYKPVINTKKLPSVVPMFRGYPEVLVCEAEGYPQPTITWTYKQDRTFEGGNLTITDATNVGIYNCTASNSVDSTIRVVKVILKEDYLPLIAGFVALVVVIISVFFIIIYSIYYKNTKMGRYMVEGAKPNAQNGNVAQNGKDSAIPMKKLSQNSLCV